ncbi:hypothetical protein GALL_310730 [mine drainage metagenome]|uniref:Uncharacterized protein n=1 Tax=mine drainage metagenome TaxID=410659 RepID=A0A1J5RBP5_9ZZZZ
MKHNLRNYPVRILIVEDIEDSLDECVHFLRQIFPNAIIDSAVTRDEAVHLVLDAHARRQPYDCAILDLRLPNNITDDRPNATTSIARLIIDKFGRNTTRLLQWTSYPEDEAIKEFINDYKIPQSGIVFEMISKTDVDHASKMAAFIKRLIAEKTVGLWLDDAYFAKLRQGDIAVVSKKACIDRPPVSLPGFVDALLTVWGFLDEHRRGQALDSLRGTDWEIAIESGKPKLKSERLVQALRDAHENAEIFDQILARRATPPSGRT